MNRSQGFLEYIKEYKANCDSVNFEDKADKFINAMLGLSYEFFCENLKITEVEKDFIQILADIKYNQILSIDKNSFFYPSKPGLQKLEEKYALFQSSMEDQ